MARTDIGRIVARAVLADVLAEAARTTDEHTDVLLKAALSVKRRRMQNVGEVIELVFVVPPDPTTPED